MDKKSDKESFMSESIYEKLDDNQKGLISEFMKDFIVSEISGQVESFIKSNVSAEGASKFIFDKDNKLENHIRDIGFPEKWEHWQSVLDHQNWAVEAIKNHFKTGYPSELKKLDSCYLVYEMEQLRVWFEEDIKQSYPEEKIVKIITDNGLEYKNPKIQNMWIGVLLFTKKHKQLINPTSGGLY